MQVGDSVFLRRTESGDLDDLIRLWNDERVMRWVGYPDGLGFDRVQAERWLEQTERDPTRRHFVVLDRDDSFCGEVFYAVDAAHERAALDVKLVPEAQGRGLASEALRALIGLVFEHEADVRAVWTEPSEENAAARRLYRRVGLEPTPRPPDLGPGSYWELDREAWERRSRAGLNGP